MVEEAKEETQDKIGHIALLSLHGEHIKQVMKLLFMMSSLNA